MTTDELWVKIDAKMSSLDAKLDDVATTVRLHEQALGNDRKEIATIKQETKASYEKMDGRVSKLEKWMWLSLGAGGAAGAGLAKLFGA